MPATVTPESVTRKVMSAASRCDSSRTAAASPPPMVPSSASPAMVATSVPLFKAYKFFLNSEMSLADCAMAPIIWRLDALGVPLPKDGKAIEDYGNRIFRNPGFTRSLTAQERHLRELPA